MDCPGGDDDDREPGEVGVGEDRLRQPRDAERRPELRQRVREQEVEHVGDDDARDDHRDHEDRAQARLSLMREVRPTASRNAMTFTSSTVTMAKPNERVAGEDRRVGEHGDVVGEPDELPLAEPDEVR